jgi:hypothetical protein
MKPLEDYMPKGNAIAYISMQTGYGRPTIERTMQRLQDEGRITPNKVAYVVLFSTADIELIIRVLKGEDK